MSRLCKLSDNEILSFALQNGIIDINTIQMQIEMNERIKYLDMHQSKIWQSTDGKWYTYLPDKNKKNGRRLIKRSSEKCIADEIVEHYKKLENDPDIYMVFSEWINKKLNYKEISKQTFDRYWIDFNKFFDEGIRKRKIKYIDESFLEDFIINSISKYNLKSKAWGNLRTIIKGMFLYAKKKGYTSINITLFLSELDISKRMFSHDKKKDENTIFTPSEINAILNEIGDSKNITDFAIKFAIYTGMRVGEIVALKWEDITDDYIFVNRTQIRYKNNDGKVVHQIRDFPKSEAGIRHVVLVKEMRDIIKKMRMINTFTEYVFDRNGECLPKHSVCTRLYYICDKLKIPRKGMHSFRRYYATTLINSGVEESIIINQIGHTDFKTTKNYYYRNNNEQEYIKNKILNAISGYTC